MPGKTKKQSPQAKAQPTAQQPWTAQQRRIVVGLERQADRLQSDIRKLSGTSGTSQGS